MLLVNPPLYTSSVAKGWYQLLDVVGFEDGQVAHTLDSVVDQCLVVNVGPQDRTESP